MTIETDLLSIGSDRPLPSGLRERLETKLVSRAWAAEREAGDLEGSDAPKVMPRPMRNKLQGTVAAVSKRALEDADAPRELPAVLRKRLERTLVPTLRRRELATRLLGIAASLVLLAGSTVAILRSGGEPAVERDRPVAGGIGVGSSEGTAATPEPTSSSLVLPPVADGAPGAGFVHLGTSSGVGEGGIGPAPPYAYGGVLNAPEGRSTAGTPASRSPYSLATIVGDEEQVAGFTAYVKAVNEAGGVAGARRLSMVVVEDGDGAPVGSVVMVNLSGTGAIGPRTDGSTPFLETLATSERALRGRVFSMAGGAEHQARIAVAAVFPNRSEGSTAVIYRRASGLFGSTIPEVIEAALEQRSVRVFQVEVEDDRPTVPVPADAAFVSLPEEDVHPWLADVGRTSYRPERGIAGIFSMASESFAADLPPRTVVVSPYAMDLSDVEVADLRRRTGRKLTAGVVHGWVTAKAIAIAMWRSDVQNAADMTDALRDLKGWNMNFLPPFTTRAGTNVRAPDGLVHEVADGRFVRRGGWRTDRG